MNIKKIKEINKNGMQLTLNLQDELLYVVEFHSKDASVTNHSWDLATALEMFDKLFERHNVKRGH